MDILKLTAWMAGGVAILVPLIILGVGYVIAWIVEGLSKRYARHEQAIGRREWQHLGIGEGMAEP